MTRRKAIRMPRARRKALEIQDLAEEVLVYDLERHRAHCLNPVATTVWRHCDGKTHLGTVAALLGRKYDLPASEDTVRFALSRLRKARLLEDDPSAAAFSEKAISSRRELLKKLGLAASAMLPAVTSIVAPSPAHAASCLPSTGCVGGVNDCAPCLNPGGNCGSNNPFRCCNGACMPPGQARNICGC